MGALPPGPPGAQTACPGTPPLTAPGAPSRRGGRKEARLARGLPGHHTGHRAPLCLLGRSVSAARPRSTCSTHSRDPHRPPGRSGGAPRTLQHKQEVATEPKNRDGEEGKINAERRSPPTRFVSGTDVTLEGVSPSESQSPATPACGTGARRPSRRCRTGRQVLTDAPAPARARRAPSGDPRRVGLATAAPSHGCRSGCPGLCRSPEG